ncbi:MAG TPA: hypothetical protein DCR94_03730, partial [Firmicutes bacterium]|nr:hypothetical protein [Bacillota bacterium]
MNSNLPFDIFLLANDFQIRSLKLPLINNKYTLSYLVEGNGKLVLANKEVRIRENTLVFINKGSIISFNLEKGAKLYKISFDEDLISMKTYLKKENLESESKNKQELSCVCLAPGSREYVSLLSNLDELIELKEDSQFYEYEITRKLLTIWLIINKNIINGYFVKKTKKLEKTKQFLSLVSLKFKESLSIKSIAKEMELSVPTLQRYLIEEIKLSPYQYLFNYRLFAAAKDIISTNKKIKAIALDNGFKTKSHFGYEFKKVLKMSPKQYRKLNSKILVNGIKKE